MGSYCQGCGEKNSCWIHPRHRCQMAEYGDGYCRECWNNLFIPKLWRYIPRMHADVKEEDIIIKNDRKYVMDIKRCKCGYKYNKREWYTMELDAQEDVNMNMNMNMNMTVDEYLDMLHKPEREKAAKVIQKGCDHWLNAPTTKDGKMGIRLRIGMRHMTCYDGLYPPQK